MSRFDTCPSEMTSPTLRYSFRILGSLTLAPQESTIVSAVSPGPNYPS